MPTTLRLVMNALKLCVALLQEGDFEKLLKSGNSINMTKNNMLIKHNDSHIMILGHSD